MTQNNDSAHELPQFVNEVSSNNKAKLQGEDDGNSDADKDEEDEETDPEEHPQSCINKAPDASDHTDRTVKDDNNRD